MGVSIIGTSGHVANGVKEFVVDTVEDIDSLPIDIKAGSTAIVLETSDVYMFSPKGEWKAL